MRARFAMVAAAAVVAACGPGVPARIPIDSAQARAIVEKGGGLSVPAGQFSVEDLQQIATLAADSGARVTITNSAILTADEMAAIAEKGPSRVDFVW